MKNKKKQMRVSSMYHILIIYCLFIAIILSTFCMMSYHSIKQIEGDVKNNAERQLKFMDNQLDDAFQSMQFSIAGLINNQDVSYFNKIKNTSDNHEILLSRARVTESLQNAVGSSQVMGSAIAFYQSSDQFIYTNTMSDDDQEKVAEFMRNVDQSGWYRLDKVSFYYVNFAPFQPRPLQTSNFHYAVAGKIRQDFIYDLIDDSNNDEDVHTLFAFPNGKTIQVNSLPKLVQSKIAQGIKENNLPTQFEIHSRLTRYQVFSRYNSRTGTWMISYLNTHMFSKRMLQTMLFSAFILILLAALAFFILILFYRKIYQNMQNMFYALTAAESGDYSARMPTSKDSDFNYVFLKYNTMLDQTERLLTSLKKETNLRENAEFRQLQAHINPHFLYNNLLFIMSMADTSPKAVIMMTSHLADYYRYVTKKNTTEVFLEQELLLAENYLTIIGLRKEIEFYVDFPEELAMQPFMQLVIQPIVENAIYHGIEMRTGSHEVNVNVSLEGSGYRISVYDDGIGLSKQKIDVLYSQINFIKPKENGSVGLWNVHKRLINRYGAESGLMIESDVETHGYGTTISMWIPIIEKEEGESV